jgi:serine phosphatase RsbU (regulator of sigma subunit)
VLYTDGVIEAADERRQQFGVDRLCAALAEVHDKPVQEIRDHLMNAVKNWMIRQDDDITFVVARFCGEERREDRKPAT